MLKSSTFQDLYVFTHSRMSANDVMGMAMVRGDWVDRLEERVFAV